MSHITEQDVSRLVTQLSDERMKTLALQLKLKLVTEAQETVKFTQVMDGDAWKINTI